MKWLLSMLIFSISHGVFSQTTKIDSLLTYYHSEKQFNGAVLVATDGTIDFVKGIGKGDPNGHQALDVKSKFKIASVSKVFTAVLVMKLVDEHKIDLDASIGTYFPDYKGPGQDVVAIDHLLTYSSGIKNILDERGLEPYQTKLSLDDFIDTYCSGELINTPGEKYAYGNTEYIILHKIVENVSQKSFEEYLYEVILAPLRMQNTGVVESDNLKDDLVDSFYLNPESKALEAEEPYFPELYFGSANMYSTVEDLFKFDQGLFDNRLLSEASTAKLLSVN